MFESRKYIYASENVVVKIGFQIFKDYTIDFLHGKVKVIFGNAKGSNTKLNSLINSNSK